MNYRDATKQLASYRERIGALRAEMREVQKAIEPQEVADYEFATTGGPVRLADLFGDKKDLFVIHNMGASCPYCTLWADGYNGIYDHLASRAGFAVASPDEPETQEKFARGRGWRFRLVSHRGTSFAADMGYRSDKGGWLPGISAFQRRNGRVVRVSDTHLGPGDDYCSLWHFLDLLPEGADSWRPRFSYG